MKSVRKTLSIIFIFSSISYAELHVGYMSDNESLLLDGPAEGVSTNSVYVGYKGNSNRIEVVNGATLESSGSTYIGWTSYAGYYGDGIAAEKNSITISGLGSHWQANSIHAGFGPNAYFNSLYILQGGTVETVSCFTGFYAGSGNQILVGDAGSLLKVTGSDPYTGLVIGYRSGGNTMSVLNGGTVESSAAIIGYGEFIYNSTNNVVTVSGENSVWDTGQHLVIGSGANSADNQLVISDGGKVISSQVVFGEGESRNNSVLISGADSTWIVDQSLQMDSAYAGEASSISVENGGSLVVNGYMFMNFTSGNTQISTLDVKNQGTLEVVHDFDASTEGFNLGIGGTLKVWGKLSNLTELKAGRSLVATNVFGNMLINGTFLLGDTSTVDGDLTLGVDGTLQLVLSSADQTMLAVTGVTDLSGAVSILYNEPMSLAFGTEIQVFDFQNGVTGGFSDISVAPLENGLYFDTGTLDSTGSMTVVPEPATAGLMGLSALCLYMMRINRGQFGTCRCFLRLRRSKIRTPVAEGW